MSQQQVSENRQTLTIRVYDNGLIQLSVQQSPVIGAGRVGGERVDTVTSGGAVSTANDMRARAMAASSRSAGGFARSAGAVSSASARERATTTGSRRSGGGAGGAGGAGGVASLERDRQRGQAGRAQVTEAPVTEVYYKADNFLKYAKGMLNKNCRYFSVILTGYFSSCDAIFDRTIDCLKEVTFLIRKIRKSQLAIVFDHPITRLQRGAQKKLLEIARKTRPRMDINFYLDVSGAFDQSTISMFDRYINAVHFTCNHPSSPILLQRIPPNAAKLKFTLTTLETDASKDFCIAIRMLLETGILSSDNLISLTIITPSDRSIVASDTLQDLQNAILVRQTRGLLENLHLLQLNDYERDIFN